MLLSPNEDVYNRIDAISAETLSLLKGPYIAGRTPAKYVHQKSNRDGDGMPRYMTHQLPAVAVYTPDQGDERDDTFGSYEIVVDMVVDVVAFAGNSDEAEDKVKAITWQARRLLRAITDQEYDHLDERVRDTGIDIAEPLWRFDNITLTLGNTVAFSTYKAQNGWIADSASGFQLEIEFQS